MAKCPKCGTDVSKPRKSWKMAGRPDRRGKSMELEIGLFDCSKCKKSFRKVLSKKKLGKGIYKQPKPPPEEE